MQSAFLAFAAATNMASETAWADVTTAATAAATGSVVAKTVTTMAGWADELTYGFSILDAESAESMSVTIYNNLEAGDVVTVALPTDEVSEFTFDDITKTEIYAAPLDLLNLDDMELLDSPTLVAWCDEDCDTPGVAMKVPTDAKKGDTYFFSLNPSKVGDLLDVAELFALVVGENSKACPGYGDPENWSCGGGLLIWILLLLVIGGGAAYFLM